MAANNTNKTNAADRTRSVSLIGLLFGKKSGVGEKYDVKVNVTDFFDPRNKAYVQWLLDASKGHRWKILFIALFTSLSSIISVRLSLVNKSLLDAVQVGDRQQFFASAILLVSVTLGVGIANSCMGYFKAWTRTGLMLEMRNKFYHKLMTKDFGELSKVNTQDWINRMNGDISSVTDVVIFEMSSIFSIVTSLITAVITLYQLDPFFILLAVVSVIPSFLFNQLITPVQREFTQVERSLNLRINSFLQEHLLHLGVVRAFGIMDLSEEMGNKHFSAFRELRLDVMRWNTKLGIVHLLFGMLTGVGLTIFCGYNILIGRITYGSMTALIALFNQVRGPVKSILDSLPRILSIFVFVDRLQTVDEIPDQVGEMLSNQEVEEFYDNKFVEMGLRDAWFAYPPIDDDRYDNEEHEDFREPVLQGMDVAIKKGQITAITGVSGYGKSTIMKVLLGLYNLDSGTRYIKTVDGEEELTPKYQRMFAYVPQGNMLMRGKIRDAVTFGIERFAEDDEKIWEALRIACADDFVRKFPNGLDTVLGELGSGLSEGQTQRISVARAIFSGHPIMMLDESTSALDAGTETRLLKNLRDIKNRTVVIITHRQSVVDICDQNLHFGGNDDL